MGNTGRPALVLTRMAKESHSAMKASTTVQTAMGTPKVLGSWSSSRRMRNR